MRQTKNTLKKIHIDISPILFPQCGQFLSWTENSLLQYGQVHNCPDKDHFHIVLLLLIRLDDIIQRHVLIAELCSSRLQGHMDGMFRTVVNARTIIGISQL